MFKISTIDEWVKRFDALVPDGLKALDGEFQFKVRGILTDFARQIDLATREEFDVQSKVLLKSRMKLEALEKRLAELEAKVKS